ncbi:MAG: hypothetical protein GF331_16560 [Chitinivibrionales bacterium]|nr:hypothetical protein [Chitinivibrionales bacterium]
MRMTRVWRGSVGVDGTCFSSEGRARGVYDNSAVATFEAFFPDSTTCDSFSVPLVAGRHLRNWRADTLVRGPGGVECGFEPDTVFEVASAAEPSDPNSYCIAHIPDTSSDEYASVARDSACSDTTRDKVRRYIDDMLFPNRSRR